MFSRRSLPAILTLMAVLVGMAQAEDRVQSELKFVAHNKAEKTAGVWVDGQYVGFVNELTGDKKIVLLPGNGFGVVDTSARVSLAKLTENEYASIGRFTRQILDEYFDAAHASMTTVQPASFLKKEISSRRSITACWVPISVYHFASAACSSRNSRTRCSSPST